MSSGDAPGRERQCSSRTRPAAGGRAPATTAGPRKRSVSGSTVQLFQCISSSSGDAVLCS